MKQPECQSPAIVFDFGGVLIDWNPRYLYQKLFADDAEAMERFLDEIGFVAWNLEQDRGRAFAVAVSERTLRSTSDISPMKSPAAIWAISPAPDTSSPRRWGPNDWGRSS